MVETGMVGLSILLGVVLGGFILLVFGRLLYLAIFQAFQIWRARQREREIDRREKT